jgi:hypothetical protein
MTTYKSEHQPYLIGVCECGAHLWGCEDWDRNRFEGGDSECMHNIFNYIIQEVIDYDLQKLKDTLSTKLFGETVESAAEAGLCIRCKEPAIPKCYSDAGRKEFSISGLCELCFDEICDE